MSTIAIAKSKKVLVVYHFPVSKPYNPIVNEKTINTELIALVDWELKIPFGLKNLRQS
jgi:hypothetical protein